MRWLIAVFMLLAAPAFAADVTVSWTPPDDERVAGYRVYYGPGNPPEANVIEVAGADTATQAITGLVEGETVYFGATSTDAAGRESVMSDVLEWVVEPGPVTISIPAKPREMRLIFE